VKEKIATLVVYAAFFAAAWFLLGIWNNYSFKRTEGVEMAPTLPKEKFKFIGLPERKTDAFRHDDVVAFDMEGIVVGGRTFFTARVIGLPGDRVRMERGDLFRNGQKLTQTFLDAGMKSDDDLEEIVVPKGHLFLLYDNRRMVFRTEGGGMVYLDSRSLGPIGVSAITGRF
jgi:signal peptidase I